MINFNHNADSIKEAFKVTPEEDAIFDEIMEQMDGNHMAAPVSWIAQRLWLDERFSDNAKVYVIFTLGRFYEFWKFIKGQQRN